MSFPSLSGWEATTSGGLIQPIKTATAALVLATSNLVATPTTAGMPLLRSASSVSITSSGLPYSTQARRPARRTGSRLYELRRLTGLTWDEIARLFHVSRRSVFLWASGRPMSSDNETLL
ncbi:MAG TPA: helix-turn-helix domain-containing protein, partial [Thermoanaerobaculia bacterium]|nr:helix-turn-helix domain-containing protein [Thermoanaerobaculia bacterium]